MSHKPIYKFQENTLKSVLIFLTFLLLSNLTMAHKPTDINIEKYKNVNSILDSLHVAASKADAKTYFNLFTEDAIYIGTDVSEYWSIKEFKSYAMPYFSKGKGWTYIHRNREIKFSESGKVAWFHEVLDNKSYGTTRGTGVLTYIDNKGWLISQYHLTIPIPNKFAAEMSGKIKAYESEVTMTNKE